MKPFAIVLLIALFLQSCGNNRKTKNEATHDAGEQKAIKAEESFDTSRKIGVGGKISYQWKKSDSLCAHASTKELIAPEVPILSGCCGSNDIVSGVRIEMIQYNREGYKVSVADSMRIDSAVLFSNHASKFDYIYHLYHKLPARPEYEERLEQLYKHDLYALIALARFHREDTKQEIIRLLTQMDKKDFWNYRDTIRTALDAVTAWPSASYKQQVRHVCQDLLNKPELYGSGRSILGALMAYNDRWSYNLIDKTLSKAKQKDQNYFDYSWGLYEAYNDNPLPLFKPLYKKYAIEE